tara:strand:- start:781 stop:2469 length:1689 start_codon:yes stop_codon:yes gene_type:complete
VRTTQFNLTLGSLALGNILAVGLLGCSETTLIGQPGAGLPTRVQATIEVSSDHPSDPLLVDFGDVYAGDTREKDVMIRNIGTDTLHIEELVIDGSFDVVNDGNWERLLAPEASTLVQLAYSPTQDEHTDGSMTVISNDRENPAVLVRLLAEGLAPAISIEPPVFDFGSPELGCVSQLEVTIANIGRAPLEIEDDGIWFEDLGGNGEMSLIHNLPEEGLVLDPMSAGGSPVTVEIHYVPTDVQPDTGVLHIESNDPSSPDATATQYGIAQLGASNIDEYYQEGNNATDILWVVDNSCSMNQEQSSLAVNFASFIQIVDAIDIDYHIGVTTTDQGDNGALQGTEHIISPNSSDPAGSFAFNVNLGTSGAIDELGLHCGYLALGGGGNNNLQPGGANYGFMRDDAGLRIIFVSDEPEQSSGVLGWGVGDYVNFFQGLKANPDHVVLSDITGGISGCSGNGGSAQNGTGFVSATNMTNGISASICDPNWVSTLSALAWLSQSFADTFELSQTPVEDSIEVRMNGVPMFVGWTYNSGLQAIVFDIDYVPENGDTLEIEYTVLGACTG